MANTSTNVSFIIPVFNTQEYIEECVESIIQSEHIENMTYEILLVNDGSTDQSEEIIQMLAEKHEQVHSLFTPHNGPGGARNYGLQHAKGEYVWFIDSDDFLVPSCFYQMYQLIKRTDADVACCNVFQFQKGKAKPSWMHLRVFSSIPVGKEITTIDENPEIVFDAITCNKLIRKQFFVDNNLQYDEGRVYEDMVLALQLLHKANKIAYLRTRGYGWRMHDTSITHTSTTENIKDKIQAIKRIFSYAEEEIGNAEVRKVLEEKLLSQYFASFLNDLTLLKDDNLVREMVDEMKEVYEQYIHEEILERASPINRQIHYDITEQNYDNLIRVINYKKTNLSHAPILNNETMVLPREIFKQGIEDVHGQYARNVPGGNIYAVEVEDNKCILYVTMYSNRVEVPTTTTQKIEAHFVNDVSKTSIPLVVTNVEVPFLTETSGTITSFDDYKQYTYNYNGAGFRIELPMDDSLFCENLVGINTIVLTYAHPLYHGVRVLRGASAEAKQKLNSLIYTKDDQAITFQMDKSNTFEVRISCGGGEDIPAKPLHIQTYVKDYKDIADNAKALAKSNRLILKQNKELELENADLKAANVAAIEINEARNYELRTLHNRYASLETKIKDTTQELEKTKKKLKTKEKELQRARTSWNYKLGAFLLWLPKKIYYFFKRGKHD